MKSTDTDNVNNKDTPHVALVNVGFLPEIGGSYRSLYEFFRRFPTGTVSVLTSHAKGDAEFDGNQDLLIDRDGIFTIIKNGGLIRHISNRLGIPRNPFTNVLNRVVFPHLLTSRMAIRRAEQFVEKQGADVLVTGQAGTSGFIGTALKKKLSIPVITFIYGEDVSLLYKGPMKEANPLITIEGCVRERFVKSLETANVVIANSKETASKAVGLGIDSKKIRVVYPGVDHALFRPDIETNSLRKKLGIIQSPIILSVGRLIRRKGFDRVVRVLPDLLRDFQNLLYIIRGEGPEKRRIFELAKKLGVSSHILFVEDLPYEDLPALYCLSDLFVTPNYTVPKTLEQEGFGMVFIEANCCGKAVIGGKSGGTVEAIKDGKTGFLIDSNSSDELKEKMLFLLNNPSVARKMGEHGREIAVKNLSWDKLSKDLYGIIKTIME